MSQETIEIDMRVITALDVYRPPKREQVMAEILKLVEDPANRHALRGFPPTERLYLADMPNGLRVIFRTDEEGKVIELVDFFRPPQWKGSGSDETRPTFAQ